MPDTAAARDQNRFGRARAARDRGNVSDPPFTPRHRAECDDALPTVSDPPGVCGAKSYALDDECDRWHIRKVCSERLLDRLISRQTVVVIGVHEPETTALARCVAGVVPSKPRWIGTNVACRPHLSF
jgi:hypothetical protein